MSKCKKHRLVETTKNKQGWLTHQVSSKLSDDEHVDVLKKLLAGVDFGKMNRGDVMGCICSYLGATATQGDLVVASLGVQIVEGIDTLSEIDQKAHRDHLFGYGLQLTLLIPALIKPGQCPHQQTQYNKGSHLDSSEDGKGDNDQCQPIVANASQENQPKDGSRTAALFEPAGLHYGKGNVTNQRRVQLFFIFELRHSERQKDLRRSYAVGNQSQRLSQAGMPIKMSDRVAKKLQKFKLYKKVQTLTATPKGILGRVLE